MKKLFSIFVAITITTILFTGCSESQTTEIGTQETETASEFYLIKIPVQIPEFNTQHSWFYKDPVTDIIYMEFRGSASGGLVWLPDPDTGLPLKYERFLELYEEYIDSGN